MSELGGGEGSCGEDWREWNRELGRGEGQVGEFGGSGVESWGGKTWAVRWRELKVEGGPGACERSSVTDFGIRLNFKRTELYSCGSFRWFASWGVSLLRCGL